MKLNKEPIRSFQAPATIRKFPSSHVYLFRSGQSDSDDSSEEELEVMELRARRNEQQWSSIGRARVGDVVLLEREVKRDDNLNKLALQYGCKVADIKRVNNFIQEQDLYAVKSIKIPVKVNGLLTETSENVLTPQCVGPLPAELSESSDRDNSSADQKKIDQYFRGIDRNIEQAAQVEVTPSTDYCIEAPNWSPPQQKETSSGVDCGIQWWNAVFVMLLVGIILPVFYIVYFKTQELEVTTDTSNMTVAVNSSLHRLARGISIHLGQEESPPTVPTSKPGAFIPSGG